MSLEEKIKNLPLQSGVYIMRDSSGNIIYIGKAVVLKNRVKQYFSQSKKPPKVQAMVDNIADFEYIITLSEKDAFSLEANLIRKHKPKYNILLKDDKSNPYLKINTSYEYPNIEITRKVKKDGAKYFGPYFNGINAKDMLEIIKSAYRLRACPKGYYMGKRECLNYHIGLCRAPCQNRIDKNEYDEIVKKVIAFLSGREDTAERLITEKMEQAVEAEEFERAIVYRNQLSMLKKLKERNLSDLGGFSDIDSFAYATDSRHSVISVSIVRSGKMMGVKNYSVTDAETEESEAIESFITQYYGSGTELPQAICLKSEFDCTALLEYLYSLSGSTTQILFPKAGMKKKLVAMAEENALDYLEKSVEKAEHALDMTVRAAEDLAKILGLPSCRRMECYDISNISGVDKVASGVVFIDGEASKSDYRRYKIKTVEGSNDFACMAEIIGRRLKRADEGDEKFADLPDLIVIDGGKGQLGAAYESMTAAGYNIPMIGLAKREEEVFTVGNPDPIILSKRSYPLKLLQRIRDESHRFAITYHRNLRSKRYGSTLDKINGVGPKKRKILLQHFERFDDIKTASVETLEAISGIDSATAHAVYEYFEQERVKKQ